MRAETRKRRDRNRSVATKSIELARERRKIPARNLSLKFAEKTCEEFALMRLIT